MARKGMGWPDWVWITVLFGGFSALMLSIGLWMMRLQGGGLELRQANPGWQVKNVPHAGLRLTHEASGTEFFIDEEDAGPIRVEPVACSAAQEQFPDWFRLPPGKSLGCVRLGNAAPYTFVLNHLSTLRIPAVWEEVYLPTVLERSLEVSGQWFTLSGQPDDKNNVAEPGKEWYAPAPGGGTAKRIAHWLRYRVDPKTTGERHVVVGAFHYGDATLVMVALRPRPF
jgi:hypothetical protein